MSSWRKNVKNSCSKWRSLDFLFLGALTSPTGHCHFIYHDSNITNTRSTNIIVWENVIEILSRHSSTDEMFLVRWVAPTARQERCFISWGHVVDDFTFSPPHVIGIASQLDNFSYFDIFSLLDCEKQRVTFVCRLFLFTSGSQTDIATKTISELPRTPSASSKQLRKHKSHRFVGETVDETLTISNFRSREMHRKHENGKSGLL